MSALNLPAFLAELDSLGIKLGLSLDAEGPDEALTPELIATLRDHKPAIAAHLAREALWEQLAPQRWGPAVDDPEPGIDSKGPADPFDLAERLAEARADEDAYAIAEREAMRWADEETT